MKNVTAETAKETGQKTSTHTLPNEDSTQSTALAHRYRQIGISAVAAAVRYQGAAKNPAYAPAPAKWLDRAEEAAA
jgi:hypothetical protein